MTVSLVSTRPLFDVVVAVEVEGVPSGLSHWLPLKIHMRAFQDSCGIVLPASSG